MRKVPTPELDKMQKVKDQSQVVGAFLDWLQNETDMVIGAWERERMYPVHKSIEELLAEYFEIDLNKVERERRALLDAIREDNL